jgi:hypothetical protein
LLHDPALIWLKAVARRDATNHQAERVDNDVVLTPLDLFAQNIARNAFAFLDLQALATLCAIDTARSHKASINSRGVGND